jgi:hypothetical protein
MSEADAHHTISEIQDVVDDIGLSQAIQSARAKAIRLVSSFGALKVSLASITT